MSPPSQRICGYLEFTYPDSDCHTFKILYDKNLLLGYDTARCDVVIRDTLRKTASVHCLIKATLKEGEDHFTVKISDRSMYGTYVGTRKLSAGEIGDLTNGSRISLGGCGPPHPTLKVTLYHPQDIICDYDLIKELGEGTFGSVHQACERTTEKLYAIKKIKPFILGTGDALQSDSVASRYWQQELEIMKNLRHRRLISLHEIRQCDTGVALVMELAKYGDLNSIILKGWGIPEALAREVVYQIADGLHYLHTSLVMVHRDVKPENVLICSVHPLKIKLADFGFAKVVDGGTIVQTRCGTPEYMAPEVVFTGTPGSQHYDFKVDSWSLGIMTFALLSGKQPFGVKTETAATALTMPGGILSYAVSSKENSSEDTDMIDRTKILWERFTPLCQDEVRDLISSLLEYDPAERLSMARVLGHAWLRIPGIAID